MIMNNILLIKPPYMELSKPDYPIPDSLLHGVKYMNPALLIHGTILKNNGFSVKIVDLEKVGAIYEHTEFIKESLMVGISCTCAWEYLETLELCKIIKNINHEIKILVGGWQIKSIKEKAFNDSEFIDYLCISSADDSMLRIAKNLQGESNFLDDYTIGRNKKFGVSLNNISVSGTVLDFTLYPNYLDYTPYVEESRGCPNKCQFCLNSCQNDVYCCTALDKFKRDVENIERIYGPEAKAILLASSFGINSKETTEKLKFLISKKIRWNLEMYIDSPWEKYIDYYKVTGIEKISVGFESASPRILKLMNKCFNVERYLHRAELLFQKLYDLNIKVTVNILFHYLENYESMKETIDFLFKNRKYLYRVRFNHMYFFEGLMANIDFSTILPYIHESKMNRRLHVYPLVPAGFKLKNLIVIMDFLERVFNNQQ